MSDVRVQDEGSIILCHLCTDDARQFVQQNVSEDRQMFGDALVVEPRYLDDLLDGMREYGLDVDY